MKDIRHYVMAVTAVAAGACAFGADYTVTAGWAAASSEHYADGTDDLTAARGWTQLFDGVAEVSNQVIYVPADAGLAYRPSAPVITNDSQVVYVHLTEMEFGRVSDDKPTGIRAALETDGTNWFAWAGVDWQKMSGQKPAEGDACDMRFEFSNSVHKVRYAIRQGDDADYTVLQTKDGSEEWLDAALVPAVTSVEAYGACAFTNISLVQTGTVTLGDTKGIEPADLDTTAANGNRNWENLVLGLNCNDANSKPVVRPVQTADPTKVTLKLDGVDVDEKSGAAVKYRVKTRRESGETEVSGWKLPNETSEMELPDAGVRYYQMEVAVSPK